MKDIYGLFIVVILAMVLFGGAALVSTESIGKGYLDDDSINLIGKYDPLVLELKNNISVQKELIEGGYEVEPDSNTLSDFYRTFAESKSKVQTFSNGVKLIYKLPDILLMSIPFTNEEDLTLYKILISLIVVLWVAIALFKAIFQQNVGGNK